MYDQWLAVNETRDKGPPLARREIKLVILNILIEDCLDISYLIGIEVIFIFSLQKYAIISASKKNFCEINFWVNILTINNSCNLILF